MKGRIWYLTIDLVLRIEKIGVHVILGQSNGWYKLFGALLRDIKLLMRDIVDLSTHKRLIRNLTAALVYAGLDVVRWNSD